MGSIVVKFVQAHRQKVKSQEIEKDIELEAITTSNVQKLLLLGPAECGKSTILKQMRILHDNGFSNEEIEKQKTIVYSNITTFMVTMLQARETLGIRISALEGNEGEIVTKKYNSSERDGPISQEVYGALKFLWAEKSLQECYERRVEYQLADCAKYFLDELDRIALADYKPTNQDMLYTRLATTGVQEIRFKIKTAVFRVFDVGGQRSERRKWIHCFDNVNSIIFIIAISEYDQLLEEDESVTRMHESMKVFAQICNSAVFSSEVSMILFLNKKDLFAAKLKKVPLTVCFPDYAGKRTYSDAVNFLNNLFMSLKNDKEKQIYVHETCATDTGQVETVLECVLDMLVVKNITGSGMS